LAPRRPPLRAILFDAGHTLLEFDYPLFTDRLKARGHRVDTAAVMAAERGARMRLDVERAEQASPGRTGEGRYMRYLLDALGIADEAERRAIAEWRRGFNAPIGLCHQADPEAAPALERARARGWAVGVISNSNGSVRRALEIAGLADDLAFVIDSTVVGVAKPDPRIFALGLEATGTAPAETLYVGDSYFVDVVGARRVGWQSVLFDPGSVWDKRGCPVVTGLAAAVEHVVA
jgi:HAD superfamily hydrolase (TIGR01509 family)